MHPDRGIGSHPLASTESALAARRGDALVYVGGVGTGFGYAGATALRKMMDTIIIPNAAARSNARASAGWRPSSPPRSSFEDGLTTASSAAPPSRALREDAEMGEVYQMDG